MFCPRCGQVIPADQRQCIGCGAVLPLPPTAAQMSNELGLLIPVNVEPVSMIAGYVGLFGLVLVGLPGPIAVALGVVGLVQIKKKPTLRGKGRAWTGIVLGGLETLVLGLLVFNALAHHH